MGFGCVRFLRQAQIKYNPVSELRCHSLITWGCSNSLSLSHSSQKFRSGFSPPSASRSNLCTPFTATCCLANTPSYTTPYPPLFSSRPIFSFEGLGVRGSLSSNFPTCAMRRLKMLPLRRSTENDQDTVIPKRVRPMPV